MPDQSPITIHHSPILLFDGVCNLCNASVKWVIKHDKKSIFRFAALQSEVGQSLLKKFNLPADELSTVVLVEGEKVFTRSDVPLRVCQKLGGAWSLMAVFFVVPKFIRNEIYDWIARNRYRWFGKQEACMVPTASLRARFLS